MFGARCFIIRDKALDEQAVDTAREGPVQPLGPRRHPASRELAHAPCTHRPAGRAPLGCALARRRGARPPQKGDRQAPPSRRSGLRPGAPPTGMVPAAPRGPGAAAAPHSGRPGCGGAEWWPGGGRAPLWSRFRFCFFCPSASAPWPPHPSGHVGRPPRRSFRRHLRPLPATLSTRLRPPCPGAEAGEYQGFD